MSGATRSSIEVAIRVRPMRPEIHETKVAWQFTPTTARELANPDTSFTFDHIYGVEASTRQLYERSVRDGIVSRVAQGYNGTVFAYGQTGSGKTFTMFGGGGARWQPGLIEMAVRDLFAALNQELLRHSASSPLATSTAAPGYFPSGGAAGDRMKRYEVFVSELEIYNEQLRDLLLPDGSKAKPLSIRENEYGVYVHNAQRIRVSSADDCLRTIYKHAEARVSASTAMNDESSRSHCIIQLHVEKTMYLGKNGDGEDDDGESDDGAESREWEDTGTAYTTDDDTDTASAASSTANGKKAATRKKPRDRKKTLFSLLNLVDLAGSERVAKTGAVGLRMVEGGHINKSLTALTTVINRLAEISNGSAGEGGAPSTRNTFVPYRDSRLTHLLKTSIGGNSFTCIFCCVTPALENVDESRSTFQFASRAKKIRNRVSVNELVNPKTRVRELEVEVRRVKRQLVAQTIYLWSKQVTIKNLQERLDTLVGDGDGGSTIAPGRGPPSAVLSPSSSSSQFRRRGGPEAQREMIMAQLQARNAELEDELAQIKAGGGGRAGSGHLPPGKDGDVADVAQLRADVADLESMLVDLTKQRSAVEQQREDWKEFCRELEADNDRQTTQVRQLEEKLKEAEGLLDDLDKDRAGAVAEAELLRSQLQKLQSKLLDRHRGDTHRDELTRLHIEHQQLQFSMNQLKESSSRQVKELEAQMTEAQQTLGDLEDEKEEAMDRCKQLNAYLWRFLAVASLASTGRVDAELGASAVAHADRPVPEKRIASALESLTKAVSASRVGEDATPTFAGHTGGSQKEVATLKAKVKELEAQIVQKDFQRDVLVDTKLKRMQDLVLRQHAINTALVAEMRQCYSDNDELFHLAEKHPKLGAKLSKAGLFPRSLQSALERARFAEPVQKPFGHN